MNTTRRRFLQTTSVAALGLADLSSLCTLTVAGVDEPKGPSEPIRFGPDLEPIVRLIEETPRDKCVPALVEQLRGGLPYRRFLAAIFLAAIRTRDHGHSAYLVHSAHQISLDLRTEERLLPLFWAVDHHKWQQEISPKPFLEPLTGPFPASENAEAEFHEAMRRFDRDQAERALIALARSEGARQAIEQLWAYGCRDVSFIGHRAIAVANCERTLETLGWQHAELVLRFVVRELYFLNGHQDGYYEPNTARVERSLAKLPAGWAGGEADRGATLELFAALRRGESEQACELAVKQLTAGQRAQAIWDAIHVAAAELMILHATSDGMAGRPVHVSTSANALHYAFSASTSAHTRLLLLLQAVAWVADFVRVHLGDKELIETKPLALEGGRLPASAEEAVAQIFAMLPPHTYSYDPKTNSGGHKLVNLEQRALPGRMVFALVSQQPDALGLYTQAARSWLCVKTTVEAHDHKLPAAIFENCEWVTPQWRPRLLAASAHWLHGPQSPDSPLIQQARDALTKG